MRCRYSAVGCDEIGCAHPRNRMPWRSMMNMSKYFVLRLLASLLLLASCAVAQTSTTSLQGTVTDPSGGAISGATVELVNTDSKLHRDATTDGQGEYRFQFLPPGTYRLSVVSSGFSRCERKDLQLLVNAPATANAQLKLGQSSQVVTVSDAPPALNMADASIGDTVVQSHVKLMPIEVPSVPHLLSLER